MRNSTEIEPAISAFATEPDDGIIVVPPLGALASAVQVINRLALQNRLPTFYNTRSAGVAEKGGLMSYGAADLADLFGRTAPIDRILRGAKPSELSFRPNSNWSSIRRPPRRSGSPFRSHSCFALTR